MNDVLLVCFRVVMSCAAWGAARALEEQRRRLVLARVAWSLQSLRRRHQVGLFTRAMWPRRGLRSAACSGVIQLAGPRHTPSSLAVQLTARVCCRPSSPSPPSRSHRSWSRATITSMEMVSAPAKPPVTHRMWCWDSRKAPRRKLRRSALLL